MVDTVYTKKKVISKDKKVAKKSVEQALECLKNIPSKECTENANRKIDEALSYCFVAKDNL
jgi:hypothetical protein